MRSISQVLDRAKAVQKVSSDYKLALCLGIGESALANYRHGRSLPDEKACQKLAESMGEDPALLTVEMQAQRAKTPEARQIWLTIAQRLQAGFSDVNLMVFIAIFSLASSALPAWAGGALAYALSLRVCILCKVANWLFRSAVHGFVKVCKVAANVPSHATPAAVLLAR